jgi:hypothetical protein
MLNPLHDKCQNISVIVMMMIMKIPIGTTISLKHYFNIIAVKYKISNEIKPLYK